MLARWMSTIALRWNGVRTLRILSLNCQSCGCASRARFRAQARTASKSLQRDLRSAAVSQIECGGRSFSTTKFTRAFLLPSAQLEVSPWDFSPKYSESHPNQFSTHSFRFDPRAIWARGPPASRTTQRLLVTQASATSFFATHTTQSTSCCTLSSARQSRTEATRQLKISKRRY